MSSSISINLIGAGNVATLLGEAFKANGIPVLVVCSRHPGKASALANTLNCSSTTEIANLSKEATFTIIAVSDQAIESIVSQISQSGILVHTSGITPLSILHPKERKCGVFYPLQSITADSKPPSKEIPFLIEGSDPEVTQQLKALADSIGSPSRIMTSEERKYAHLAAVFINNFSNHMAVIAAELLREKNIPFDLYHPLIRETARKLMVMDPLLAQTGPARRNDLNTLEQHKLLLKDHPHFLHIYEQISESIGHFRPDDEAK